MASYIARHIMTDADESLEAGQAKYRAYFVSRNTYAKFQPDVDEILELSGYGDCIVTE